MPIFLDRHDLSGMSAADIAEAHRHDLAAQDKYGVRFLTYWFDGVLGTGFCLIDAPGGGAARPQDFDSACRAVFTDIVGSTEMTARLGEARALELVRAHATPLGPMALKGFAEPVPVFSIGWQ